MPFRIDGRKNSELRKINVVPGFLKNPAGSALIEFGNTRVLCSASVIEEVPPWMKAQKKTGGWLTGEYQMIPASTAERNKREINHVSGRTQEIQRLIGRSLRAAIDLEKLSTRTIYIDCEVLDADGGTRCASVTGGMIALDLAVKKMISEGKLKENPLISRVAAVSVGIRNGIVILDLCYEEDSNADVDMNVIMNEKLQLIELQATSERAPFTSEDLAKLLDLAQFGIKKIFKIQKNAVAPT